MTIRDLDGKEDVTRVGFGPGTILVQPGDGEEMVFISNGTVQVYQKDENKVMEFPMPMMEMIPDIKETVLNEVSMTKMLQQYEQEYGKANIKIGPIRLLNGRRVYEAALNNPKENERVLLVADAETDLPIQIDAWKGNKKRRRSRPATTARCLRVRSSPASSGREVREVRYFEDYRRRSERRRPSARLQVRLEVGIKTASTSSSVEASSFRDFVTTLESRSPGLMSVHL